MRLYKLVFGSFLFVITSVDAFAKCPANVGERVNFRSAASTYDLLSSSKPSPKGEFETSEAYEKRIASTNFQSPILTKIEFDIKNLSYDADNERFIFKKYALDGYVDWDSVLYKVRSDLTPDPLIDDEHGIELKSIETFSKSYTASNAYGQTTTVKQYKRNKYALFDKFTPWRKEINGNWQTEFKHPHTFEGSGNVYKHLT